LSFSGIRTQILNPLNWISQPLWSLDHQEWDKNIWFNDKLKTLPRLKFNIEKGQQLIEIFISHEYISISQLITNILERYQNDCFDISIPKRSNGTEFWKILYYSVYLVVSSSFPLYRILSIFL
jgi:hypothetical protein